jgi:hypothetical protein
LGLKSYVFYSFVLCSIVAQCSILALEQGESL